jgi:hypothetical protein
MGAAAPIGPLKPVPLTVSTFTVRATLLGFLSVKTLSGLLPSSTDPKSITAPAASGVLLPPTVRVADGVAVPSSVMLIVFTSRVALWVAMAVGLKSTRNSANEPGAIV